MGSAIGGSRNAKKPSFVLHDGPFVGSLESYVGPDVLHPLPALWRMMHFSCHRGIRCAVITCGLEALPVHIVLRHVALCSDHRHAKGSGTRTVQATVSTIHDGWFRGPLFAWEHPP